jgi:dipeptide transport system ATP-binding protein
MAVTCLKMGAAERQKLIGREITMIFQEPVASLNPSFHSRVSDRGSAALQPRAWTARRHVPGRWNCSMRSASPNLQTKLNAYPHQMSGGQCQRVMIAIAIASNPRLLIADEPTTALDVTIQKQILDLLMDLQEKHGMALILITHDMGVVAETADRVIVQYKGRKMEEADVLDLFENPQNPYTRALLSALPENAKGDRLPTVADFMAAEALK